ncbi:hypothetical protein [Granulicella mallensis]|uniref:Uncharacterized protein n=1 Tax=Granulicella mallensis TaxID=940614 RepID=A0A7W7ZLZ6_9BACT|nr:hypothetical protein [Granulicella mallensis]MBB5062394.1 hypothetical protein [Granulicella mallensis]
MTTDIKKTPAAAILVAWLIVGIPAGWGVYNTALNAKKIFAAPPPATATTTPTTAAK